MKYSTRIGIAIAAIGIVIALFAFQGPTQKTGVIDIGRASDLSKLGKRKKSEFDAKQQKWINMLNFMRQNRFFTPDNAKKFRELSLVEKPTAEQTQSLEGLKTSIQKITDEFQNLIKVTQPNDEQVKRRQELLRMADETVQMMNELGAEYRDSMQTLAGDLKEEVTNKARQSVQKYGKKEGFTIIFESSIAVYGANDVTDEVVKIMDVDFP
ncbi:MAG: OmpH family outer membrane protein [Fimbriimonadales bacterium]